MHGIDKGLNLHVKPERQKSVAMLPTDKMPAIETILPIDKGPPTELKPPIPKPRIGQRRAGIRRKDRVIMPTPTPIQTPAPPKLNHAPRAVQSLLKPMVQSKERLQPWHHLPAPLPLFKPTRHRHHIANRTQD